MLISFDLLSVTFVFQSELSLQGILGLRWQLKMACCMQRKNHIKYIAQQCTTII